jgi:hypothetical protein
MVLLGATPSALRASRVFEATLSLPAGSRWASAGHLRHADLDRLLEVALSGALKAVQAVVRLSQAPLSSVIAFRGKIIARGFLP